MRIMCLVFNKINKFYAREECEGQMFLLSVLMCPCACQNGEIISVNARARNRGNLARVLEELSSLIRQ